MIIDTLVEDIYSVMENGTEVSDEVALNFGRLLSNIIKDRVEKPNKEPYLRMSNIGTSCDRKLWGMINTPDAFEKLDGATRLKFLIGDIHEAVLLFLAEVSGHKVEGRQDEVNLYGIPGSRDAIIDGNVVDVKSASPYSFKKFVGGLHPSDDAFGYISQLSGYLEAANSDDKVHDKETAYFLVSDKVSGELTLSPLHKDVDKDWRLFVASKQMMVEQAEWPERGYEDVPEGKSGNRKLGTQCSYCGLKSSCWNGLRGFAYANGPMYLTTVVREPNVFEFKV